MPFIVSGSPMRTREAPEAWEKAMQVTQSTAKLNPQDADAKFNYKFVKQRLEELKQQQQQSKAGTRTTSRRIRDQQKEA